VSHATLATRRLAGPFLGRTFTDWIAPASWRTFDLAYDASHAFAGAALRQKGYRSEDRYVVFQALPRTAGLDATAVRVFAKAHNERNLAEYEGRTEIDEKLLADLLRYATQLEKAVAGLEPPA
jgi:hypothetical protein